jgi:hypothetical protein
MPSAVATSRGEREGGCRRDALGRLAAQSRVVGEVDDAHPTLPEGPLDGVTIDGVPRREHSAQFNVLRGSDGRARGALPFRFVLHRHRPKALPGQCLHL